MEKNLKKRGFSLIEALVVIAIISMLSALSLPVYRKARSKALTVKTQTMLNSVEAALSMYSTDFGDYPYHNGEGTGILVFLIQGPLESTLWRGPYMRFKEKEIDSEGNLLDPWESPLSYKYPQDEHSNVPYIIVSAGADRRFGSSDDIGNW